MQKLEKYVEYFRNFKRYFFQLDLYKRKVYVDYLGLKYVVIVGDWILVILIVYR